MTRKLDSLQALTDEEIVVQIVTANKRELFSILYSRFQKRVFDKCYNLVKDSQLAKELTQEIFTKAFEKIDKFRGEATFSSWIYVITYNHCIEFLRHKRKLHYPEWNGSHEIAEIVDESEKEFAKIKYDRMLQIFDQIHPEEKTLLLMKYLDNLPMKSIQETLKISESAAKMRIKRAKARVLYLYKINYENNGH
ncbi:MAG TPA: RNA polymerase sigma factor [Bacteroidales bacterium]